MFLEDGDGCCRAFRALHPIPPPRVESWTPHKSSIKYVDRKLISPNTFKSRWKCNQDAQRMGSCHTISVGVLGHIRNTSDTSVKASDFPTRTHNVLFTVQGRYMDKRLPISTFPFSASLFYFSKASWPIWNRRISHIKVPQTINNKWQHKLIIESSYRIHRHTDVRSPDRLTLNPWWIYLFTDQVHFEVSQRRKATLKGQNSLTLFLCSMLTLVTDKMR